MLYALPGTTVGVQQVYAWAKDAAGNVSSPTHFTTTFTHDLTLGQNSGNEVSSATTSISQAYSTHSNGTQFLVADGPNGRVLLFSGDPTSNPPALALGKPSLTSVGRHVVGSLNESVLGFAMSAVFVGSKIVAVDNDNNRILIWNSIPSTSGAPADVILGQSDTTGGAANRGGVSCASLSGPRTLATDGTKLAVTDTVNNRILIWNTLPTTNFAPADVVVGQPDCTTVTSGGSDVKLKTPYSIAFIGFEIWRCRFG